MKKKWFSFLILFLLTAVVLSGCGGGETPVQDEQTGEQKEEKADQTEETAFPVTIKDANDQEVTIEAEPERIVSLVPSNTEIAFALGLGDEIVGVSDHDNYPEETAEKEKIGGMDMNIEKIISLQPDLVLAHESALHSSEAGLQQLRDAGITVLVVNEAVNFETVYDSIYMIGKATGKPEEAEEIVTTMKERVENVRTKAAEITEKKSVVFEIMPAPDIYVAGSNTFMDEILTIINAENAVGDLEGWPKINEETMIERNPDIIITTYGHYTENPVELVLKRDGWQDVNAVKNKQVYDVVSDHIARSGPRLAEGVEEVAKAVYPEVFN
ncbi:ABC transporter substrate-binding protein [Bacillus dakarensis]|uniref:ABC transporter substrate-binding protein n=1 Tax=Robertmurraya dakarensis TaxID=1926278 RepID=UPI000981E74D|nr:ABC transporter substrate-binding protein [Bacillus dakarensis]